VSSSTLTIAEVTRLKELPSSIVQYAKVTLFYKVRDKPLNSPNQLRNTFKHMSLLQRV
jgi:hypothetical protein